MVGVLVSANYKYTDVQLSNGIKVTATGVTIKDGKVIRVDNGNVTIGEKDANDGFGMMNPNGFTFSAYTSEGKLKYSTSDVPSDFNGQNIAEEFVAFVEADLKA